MIKSAPALYALAIGVCVLGAIYAGNDHSDDSPKDFVDPHPGQGFVSTPPPAPVWYIQESSREKCIETDAPAVMIQSLNHDGLSPRTKDFNSGTDSAHVEVTYYDIALRVIVYTYWRNQNPCEAALAGGSIPDRYP